MDTLEPLIRFLDTFEAFILLAVIIALVLARKKAIGYLYSALGMPDVKRELAKSRLLINIYLIPSKVEVIEEDYRKYKELGGNGYIDGLIEEWHFAQRAGWNGIEKRQDKQEVRK